MIKANELQRICDQISEEIDALVTIFADKGKVVCSSQRSRIGMFHDGVAKIMTGEVNRYEASIEDSDENPNFLEGVALPIEIDGVRHFCVSVAAPIAIARPYCRLIQHWVVSLLRELALASSEARFRDVAESAGDWIWEMNEELRFTYLSPRFYEIFRVEPEAILGKTRGEWTAVDKKSEEWREHQAKLAAHLPYRDFVLTLENGVGEIRHAKVNGKPMYRSTGEFAGYRGTGSDVTEQIKMERALGRSQQLLVDSIEIIPEAFSLFDNEDRLVVFNSKYCALLQEDIGVDIEPGMTFETIIRQGAATGGIPEAQGRIEEWVHERLQRHRTLSEPHIQQRGDGWTLVSEHRTSDGGTVAIYSDVTEIKQREQELAEKSNAMERLSKQLAKYLSPQIYESIFSGRREVKLDSRRKKLTIFFSDIVGFTETADRLESEDLTQLLNHYLSDMSEIALSHGATIDKYIGDAMLIFFGDPESGGVKRDARQCAKMALEMQRRMVNLQQAWSDAGIDRPLRCRMGINTGFCTVGNFGSENRMDYTIIGSGVNLASRLESLAKPGEILISYETFALISDAFRCEERGEIEVRGLAYPVATYGLIEERMVDEKATAPIHEENSSFKLQFDLEQMTDYQRDAAERNLERALDTIRASKD